MKRLLRAIVSPFVAIAGASIEKGLENPGLKRKCKRSWLWYWAKDVQEYTLHGTMTRRANEQGWEFEDGKDK